MSDDLSVVAGVIDKLSRDLTALRDSLTPTDWEAAILTLRSSPLLPILLKDPFTCWSYHRPRGFAGDAGLTDFIYAQGYCGKALANTSAIGRRIFSAIQIRPLCKAVRFRRQLAEEFLREVLLTANRPRVLVIAAGHLREVGGVLACEFGIAGRVLALDADQAALECIGARLPEVETRCQSVHDLLSAAPEVAPFDATYALGLYDSLTDTTAEKLLALQVAMVRPGGRLLVCNFAPDAADRGYMEAFMDWKLIYRDEHDMQRLAQRADPSCAIRVYREPSRQLVFLELTRNR